MQSDSTKGVPQKYLVYITEIYCKSPSYRKVQDQSPIRYCDIRLNKVAISRVVNGFLETESERVEKEKH